MLTKKTEQHIVKIRSSAQWRRQTLANRNRFTAFLLKKKSMRPKLMFPTIVYKVIRNQRKILYKTYILTFLSKFPLFIFF